MNQIPRRAYLDKLVPAERAIFDAIQAVEVMGADVRLTDVVVALGAAKDKLSDYVDAETVQYSCGASASKGAPTVCPEHGSECHMADLRLADEALLLKFREIAKNCAADGTNCVHIGTVLLMLDELEHALRACAEAP